jgi:glycosyltransferase involved in cell wall biosynthesis
MRAAGMSFETLAIGGKANLLALPRLSRASRRLQTNLLHSHLSTASWWCGWLEQFGGPPSIGHVHGFTSAVWHRRQSHLIACSEAVRQDLIEKRISRDRISVMHYPVDPGDMRPRRSPVAVRDELGAEANTPVVGTFAHLSEKKGYRELVQSAALVLARLPEAQFWCFGDGPLRPELEQTAKQLRIADRFRLFGFRRDVPDLMRSIDVMCLPSHREPFGLVYVEAALAEKPVIACNAGGAREIITHGETGLLAPPPVAPGATGSASERNTNVPSLAAAILQILTNRDQSAAMGRRARQQALDRFGWPAYLQKLHDLYGQVMSTRHAAHPTKRKAA